MFGVNVAEKLVDEWANPAVDRLLGGLQALAAAGRRKKPKQQRRQRSGRHSSQEERRFSAQVRELVHAEELRRGRLI